MTINVSSLIEPSSQQQIKCCCLSIAIRSIKDIIKTVGQLNLDKQIKHFLSSGCAVLTIPLSGPLIPLWCVAWDPKNSCSPRTQTIEPSLLVETQMHFEMVSIQQPLFLAVIILCLNPFSMVVKGQINVPELIKLNTFPDTVAPSGVYMILSLYELCKHH